MIPLASACEYSRIRLPLWLVLFCPDIGPGCDRLTGEESVGFGLTDFILDVKTIKSKIISEWQN